MCGIVGFLGKGNKDDIWEMLNNISHRGPDALSVEDYPDHGLYIGHARLSIVDDNDGGQPMWDKNRAIGVIYNGEIYNANELRIELEANGHVFQTSHSDTEVLIHGYKQWGSDLFLKLNGMFALAIIDKARRNIIFARDRFGEKPLYIYKSTDLLAFASEISCFKKHKYIQLSIHLKNVQKYMGYGFFPKSTCLYNNCEKLEAGRFMICDFNGNIIDKKCYWQFTINEDMSFCHRDENEITEEFLSLLDNAVKIRLMSDHPIGILLSGGIDSSAILASMSQYNSEPVNAFTIGFDNASFDETEKAKIVAKIYNAQHHINTLPSQHIKSLANEVIDRLDEPLGDSSLLPTYLAYKGASEHAKVVLSGDGADELLAGYAPFRALKLAQLYQKNLPLRAHEFVKSLVQKIPASTNYMTLAYKLQRTLKGIDYPIKLWNPTWLSPADPMQIKDLFTNSLTDEEIYSEAIELWNEKPHQSIQHKTLEFYSRLYLTDNILTKSDRTSMMNSIESRAVFLDNHLVDFLSKLPFSFKMRGSIQKHILKKAMAMRLPKSILRQKKQGFAVPISKWFLNDDGNWIDKQKLLNNQQLKKFLFEHQDRQQDHRLLLWSSFVLKQKIV